MVAGLGICKRKSDETVGNSQQKWLHMTDSTQVMTNKQQNEISGSQNIAYTTYGIERKDSFRSSKQIAEKNNCQAQKSNRQERQLGRMYQTESDQEWEVI